MNRRIELLCAWCGPTFLVVFVAGLWFVAGLIPPPSPSDSAEHTAAFYRANAGQVRLGMLICMLGSVLFVPFVALVSRQIRRSSPRLELLADVQLICGVVAVVILLLFELLLATIAFRPDMSPQVLRALNDLAWTTLLWPFSPFSLEYAAVGIAVLIDPRSGRCTPDGWASSRSSLPRSSPSAVRRCGRCTERFRGMDCSRCGSSSAHSGYGCT